MAHDILLLKLLYTVNVFTTDGTDLKWELLWFTYTVQ